MAVIPLYRVKSHIKAPKWARFPEDFDVIEEAELDDCLIDHALIAGFRWSLKKPDKKSRTGRARRFEGKNPRRCVYLSRVVWEIANGPIPEGMTVDHENLNSLDDRLENLRLADQRQQNRNQAKKRTASSTPYKGSVYHPYGSPKAKKYHGVISPKEHVMCCLGYYRTPEEAGFAYNCAAELCYREFARLNEIPPDSISPDRQQEIRSVVERKLRDRGLIPSEC